jgi:LacI family transcriptional regulator
MTAPSLSTVRLPLRDMGRLGFEAALSALEGVRVQPQLLPTQVILRDSTAPPARGS